MTPLVTYAALISHPTRRFADLVGRRVCLLLKIEFGKYLLTCQKLQKKYDHKIKLLLVYTDITNLTGFKLNKFHQIRQMNMYNDGDTTHYGQNIGKCQAHSCMNECIERSKFEQRKQDIETFNQAHK